MLQAVAQQQCSTVKAMRSATRRLGSIIIVAMLATACGGESRPSAEEWQPQWIEVQSLVPDQADLGAPPDKDMCREAHVALRTETPRLLPTPDLALDDPVRDWVEIAEGTFFECPPREPELRGFDEAYAELTRFAAEINAVLAIDLEEE